MDIEIGPFSSGDEAEIIEISIRAWAPVFEELEPAVPNYVFKAFYPDGWAARQVSDIRKFLRDEGEKTFVAKAAGAIVGWVGLRLHPQDRMGEIYILAVDPGCQRKGVAACLMERAKCEMRRAGMRIVMVETGDDPGHAASRATYENAGFRRWPVARYFREL
ncbi:GNAT family N-acetyltransferase [Muricoccus aerilatus]|uniref:GNAT family N-acetyltransferase n=1 Tax=Muricoccus aerilatus TaxID=452982 RepID=UPI000B325F8C|nr:GNAT family N-acetyltransferase [Roseomonas aerilata]